MKTPEARARLQIDAALEAAGWCGQDVPAVDLHAGQVVHQYPNDERATALLTRIEAERAVGGGYRRPQAWRARRSRRAQEGQLDLG